jgi:hypothetical protein
MSISNKDNTLRGARNLGRLAGSRRVNGFVGLKDKIDFAKFSLSDGSDFRLSLGRVTGRASARVTLRNNRGGILRSFKSGAKPKTFSASLAAGTYFIGIQRLRGEVKYKIATSAKVTPIGENPNNGGIPNDNEPGEILATARDIGVLSGTYTNQEFVGTTDAADLYKFTLNDVANLQARVTGTSARTRIELIRDGNSNGLIDSDEILASDTSFSSNFLSSVTQDLPPGTYFMRVAPSSSTASTQYQLNLVATPFGGNISPEPGNTLPVARNLGAFSGTFSAKEYVGIVDSSDVYQFTLNDISNLQISVKGSSATAGLRLIRDINGNGLIDNNEVIASDTSFSSTFFSSVTQDVPAGTYFVSIDPRSTSGSTLYELNLVATPFGGTLSSDPGNTLFAARDLGALSGTFSAKEYTGVLDSDDFYKFTLNNPANLQARVNGTSATAGVQLIQDVNGNGLIDNNETLASDTSFSSTFQSEINRSLASGSYFVRVLPRSSGDSTNYSLSLTV